MCITPADVTEVKCLFYQHLLDLIKSNQYGIECSTEDLLSQIKKLYNHWNFECYSNDYIRNIVLDSTPEFCETRDTSVPGIVE